MSTPAVKAISTSIPVAAVYFFAAKISFLLTIPPGNISPIFPAAGVALAAAMLIGPEALFGIWLGSFAANTLSFFDGSMPSTHPGGANILVGAFIGLGAMLGALAGATLVRRICKGERPLQSGRNVLAIVFAGALGCCTISPTLGVFGMSLAGNIPWERFGYSWLTWWVGDSTGTLIAAPLLLAWNDSSSFALSFRRIPEASALGIATVLTCIFAFFFKVPCAYALLPLLLWAAFRFGMRGVSTTAAVMALLSTIGVGRGGSLFVAKTACESLLFLNSFFGVTITCALFLAGIMEERKQADARLLQLNRALRTISECNQAMVHATDETALLTRVCHILTDLSGYRLAWVGFAEQDEGKTVRPVAQTGFEAGYLESLRITWGDTERGRGPTGVAIRTGLPCAANSISRDPRFAPWREDALKRGYASSLVLPLKGDDRVFGALNIYSARQDSFDEEETKLLTEMADDLAYGITALRTRAKQIQAETALRESEERLRTLGDNLPDSYVYQYTRDEDGGPRFLHVSAGVERLQGVKVEEVLRDANLLRGRIAPELAPAVEAAEAASLQNLSDFRMDLPVRCVDGQNRWLRLCSRPRILPGGKVVWDGVATDITARKQAEAARKAAEQKIQQLNEDLRQYAANLERRVEERTAELAVARDRAEESDRLKSAFLATMSHELRTPLNSIIGFTGIILQGLAGPLTPEQKKQLEMVRGSSRHLLALINDVLDISKIEAGQVEIASEEFDLRASFEKAAATVRVLAEKKALALKVHLAPEIGAWVGDRRRFEQILINLLNNAIKFTERGEVALTAGVESGSIHISVADSGIGIQPGDLEKLFQPFHQLDTGLARNHEGTGLGLAICRRLTELLGGRIFAESQWGKGSTFTVVFPLQSGAK